MNSNLANEYAERSRIEQGICECDLSILRINEDRLRLAIGLAECKSFHQLLARRRCTLRTRYRNSTPWRNGAFRRLSTSR
jgi:hypothetical protein